MRDDFVKRTQADLLAVASGLVRTDPAHLESRSRLLLHHPPSLVGPLGGHSDLNWNGAPLQLAISSREERLSCRLVGDPAFFLVDPLERFQESLEALDATLVESGAQALRELCGQGLLALLPRGREALQRYPRGMMLLATALERPGVALYVGVEPAEPEVPWRRARNWLGTTLPHPDEALRVIRGLEPGCLLLGGGLEGREPETARAKLYWTLRRPARLVDFGIGLYHHPALQAFLAALLGDASLPLESLVFSAGFSAATGALVDVKVDVSTRYLGRSQESLLAFLERQARTLGLRSPPLGDSLTGPDARPVSIAFLGLGVDHEDSPRLNTYLYQHTSS